MSAASQEGLHDTTWRKGVAFVDLCVYELQASDNGYGLNM